MLGDEGDNDMRPLWLDGKKYHAEAARPSSGPYPYTCSAFIETTKGLFPVRTQVKLYHLALILRGESVSGKKQPSKVERIVSKPKELPRRTQKA